MIGWHDETLRRLVGEYGGEEVKNTGDGFFLAFDDTAAAIDCAIAIQRRMTEQRQKQGFAPSVRIGIHRASASRVGLDYVGKGVNEAARIAALAQGGEIVISARTLDEAGPRREVVERRTVVLKGLSTPVEVASIAW